MVTRSGAPGAPRLGRAAKVSLLAAAAIVLFSLVSAGVSQAGTQISRAKALKIYENRGVGKARLGQRDRKAVKKLGMKPTRSGADNEYDGQTIYYYYFGNKLSSGVYELEMYADKRHKVFMFAANGTQYKTKKKIRVGSTEKKLLKAYGRALKKRSGDVVTQYSLGGRRGTDFYVAGGKVIQIVVRKF